MKPTPERRRLPAALALLALLPAAALAPRAAAQPAIALQALATGLADPVGVVNAGDGSGRLFFVLQQGRIAVFDGTRALPVPFLDITRLVLSGGEQGLLGLAFHPRYRSTGFFYVYYTRRADGTIVIARYRVSGDPNVADPGSALTLLTVPHPTFTNHNGGQLQFGPDGRLYAGVGDGGSRGDPNNHGQDRGSLLGKVLRLDVDAGPPWIPAGNPFGTLVWHYGLRNPWRFTFDRRTGDMFIGDVGQNAIEEVDFQPAGQGGLNFGWRRMEGSRCFNPKRDCNPGGLTLPILEYAHADGSRSIVGGYRYRGSGVVGLAGTYLYGDTYSGRIWGATQGPGGGWRSVRLLDTGLFISTFGEDEAGELYVAHLAAGSGAVHRIVAGASPLHRRRRRGRHRSGPRRPRSGRSAGRAPAGPPTCAARARPPC